MKTKPTPKRAVVRIGNLGFTKVMGKEVVMLFGRGENCECSDCPVLYGGDCPFDSLPRKPITNKKK